MADTECQLELQERDWAILRGLLESRVMTSAHASAIFFEGRAEAGKKRLQKLKAAGFIGERIRRVNQPAILFLTRKGFLALKDPGTTNNGGGNPYAGLVQGGDGNFYGTTYLGGVYGTIYQLTPTGALNTIYAFTGNTGGGPTSGLAQSADGNLYGITTGTFLLNHLISGNSTLFRVETNEEFTNLYSFAEDSPDAIIAANDGNLYGTTASGGASNAGTIFQMPTNGVLTTLYSFTGGNDGNGPGGLIQATDGTFYGTTGSGGLNTNGSVFRFTTNGGLTTLYSFTGGIDGSAPNSGVFQVSDDDLYGTTFSGGANGAGTVFRITTNGAFTSLHSLNGAGDGSNCYAGLFQASDGNLYGTTYSGGASNLGTVFRITTNGSFTVLHSFAGGAEGGNSVANLMQANDGFLYGTTQSAVFRMDTNGNYSTIGTLSGLVGSNSSGGLTQARDGNLYGVCSGGGVIGFGTIFRVVISGARTLQVQPLSNGNFAFALPAAVGQSYTIQQTTNLATTNWTFFTNLVGAGTTVQLSVPATNSAQFFRLRGP